MQICIATDKFKGSLTAFDAAESIREGFSRVLPDAGFLEVPMADGGDGSFAILQKSVEGKVIEVPTFDAQMKEITAPLFVFDGGRSVFIESATVCGIAMLDPNDRNPKTATSYGLGVLIRRALDEGADRIYIGLGGTATNDVGTGMMSALGCRYLTAAGEEVSRGCLPLADIRRIDDSGLDRRFIASKIYAVTDVSNLLLGKEGATYTYALQKGASRKDLEDMEKAVCSFSEVYMQKYGKRLDRIDGGGAAGGLGAMILAQHRGFRIEGWKFFADLQQLEARIAEADLVITGEGRFDTQSLSGKVIDGVEELCRRQNKPLWVFCGKSDVTQEQLVICPAIEQIFRISDIEPNAQLSIRYADKLLKELAMLAAKTL